MNTFDKVSLGIFPTPIHKLENISRLLGTQIYIKRDDMTGLALGGNKVRKLEYLLADAKKQGAQVVFTTGGAQSNHAMLTAAAANKLGMKPILILKKRGVTARQGNQLLEHLMGVDVRFMDTDDYADIAINMKKNSPVKAMCLHISHDCNLRCKYCFADEGAYHNRRELMSLEPV